jgi:hypothetical protein
VADLGQASHHFKGGDSHLPVVRSPIPASLRQLPCLDRTNQDMALSRSAKVPNTGGVTHNWEKSFPQL